ncbi:MAG TPA: glycerophosphodiester phosphodiesterase [Acidimicrobiia bacterium]|nr:glycerophosphodiester phosphodiesterase [Acidimicrobiia bacterium]
MPDTVLILGHRGASHDARENTLEAFALARAQGADGVELDVRRTADGELVVHHDPHVPGVGLLAQLPFARLREEAPFVPTLGEALAACEGMLVNVEVKCLPWEPDADHESQVAKASADLIRAMGAHTVMSSFHFAAIDALRTYAPEIPTGFLVHGQDLAFTRDLVKMRGHEWLHPDRGSMLATDTAAVVRTCHEENLRVNVWTVDDPDEMRRLADAGVDGIITNVPAVAVSVLR